STQIAGQAVELLDRSEAVHAARYQFVRVGLMADVPDELVIRRIERNVQRQRQLNRAQVRREMPAAQGHGLDDLLAHLLGKEAELGWRQLTEVGGAVDAV